MSIDRNHPEVVEISRKATPADVVSALRVRSVRKSHGYLAALDSKSAGRLARKFGIGRCLGIVVDRILDDHVPTLPFEHQYQKSRERVLNMERHGQINEQERDRRLDRIRETRDERAAKWHRFDARVARRRYKDLSDSEKVRERLKFRAHRPRT